MKTTLKQIQIIITILMVSLSSFAIEIDDHMIEEGLRTQQNMFSQVRQSTGSEQKVEKKIEVGTESSEPVVKAEIPETPAS